jgi:hypothetical protein
MDRLGGILTGGLLGNLILGRFNLFFGIIDVEVVSRGGAGSAVTGLPDDKEYYVYMRVSLFNKNYNRTYLVKEKTAKVIVKTFEKIKNVKQKFDVKAKLKEKTKFQLE